MSASRSILLFALIFSGGLRGCDTPVSGSPSDPDYQWIREHIDQSKQQLANDESWQGIDWARLSGPTWSYVCTIGGYLAPGPIIDRVGGTPSEIQRADWWRAVASVAEHDMFVAIIYPDETVRILVFAHGHPHVVQHEWECTTNPELPPTAN